VAKGLSGDQGRGGLDPGGQPARAEKQGVGQKGRFVGRGKKKRRKTPIWKKGIEGYDKPKKGTEVKLASLKKRGGEGDTGESGCKTSWCREAKGVRGTEVSHFRRLQQGISSFFQSQNSG